MPTDSTQDSIQTVLLGGALAGVISDSVVHPIDTIRARLQVQNKSSDFTVGRTNYRSATHALTQIIKTEGPLALYRGFSIVAIGTIPGHALYFAGYELSKSFLNKHLKNKKDDSIAVHLLSGLIADVSGSLAWTPMDVIKQRLQVSGARYKNSFHAFRLIIAEEGMRGLFRGFGAGIATYGPYVSLYFALYEQFKLFAASEKMLNTQDVNKLPFYVYLFGAAFAATISAGVTCPLDVVKTRIQVEERMPSGSYKNKNAFELFKHIIKEEGISALFQGIKPRCLWIAGGTTVTMLAYEEIKKLRRE
jgi:solute carrier family 25 iron transporter 28/37